METYCPMGLFCCRKSHFLQLWKIFENEYIFIARSLNGYLCLPKQLLKLGEGFKNGATYHHPNQICDLISAFIIVWLLPRARLFTLNFPN